MTLTITLTVFGVLFVPTLAFVIRAAMRWTKIESRLDQIVGDVRQLVKDKDETHREIILTMRDDRAATDKRLRWLEEHLWRKET